MPKCTVTQIKAEIERLRGTGFKCAIEYLQAELDRRSASSRNKGRPVKYNDEKRVKNRESARRSREKKPITDTPKYDELEGA